MKKKFAVGIGLSAVLLAWAASQSHRDGAFADTFDNDYQGWSAGKTQLSISTAEKREGRGSLEWRFDYVRDALFLFTRSNLKRFAGADGISFWIKSDRDAPLFLRVDLGIRSPFITVFPVGREWKQLTFRFEDLQPAGKSKRMNTGEISAIYLVDLGGKDNGLTGSRTIWVDNLRPTGGAVQETNSGAGGEGGRSSDLVVKAYDEKGALLSEAELKDRGLSAGTAMFASDLEGTSVGLSASSTRVSGKSVPALAVEPRNGIALNFLFWVVPGYGKVWLRADNGGQGYRDGAAINANYELARSRFTRLENAMRGSGLQDAAVAKLAAEARDFVGRAERENDDSRKAALADRGLSAALHASDALQLAVARRDIERYRKGDLQITLLGPDGRPAPNATVSYRQTRSSVLLGCIQSFGFIDQKTNEERMESTAELLKDAGFNHFTVSLFWDRIEPKKGSMNLDDWDRKLGLQSFAKRGFTFTAHAMVQSALPDYVKKEGPRAFAQNATRHVEAVMRHYMEKYPGRVKIWQAINEPSSNRYVGLNMDEKVDLIKSLSETIRRTDPRGSVLVNDYDWDRGQRHKANLLQPDLRDMISSYEYFRMLNERRTPYDIMGLQWYPGLRVIYGGGIIDLSEPLLDFAGTSDVWDRYGRLGKPLHITEMATPGVYQREWKNGYWHEPWNPNVQAEYMANIYTIAFSKPYIHEITYWGITDHEPWALKGGLLNDRYEPKPLYRALKSLFASWRTEGTGRTDRNGRLTIRGFAGDYELEVQGRGSREPVRVIIPEGRSSSVDLRM